VSVAEMGFEVTCLTIYRSARSKYIEEHTNWAYISYTFVEEIDEYANYLLQDLLLVGHIRGAKLN
jgi:hypothetical protein